MGKKLKFRDANEGEKFTDYMDEMWWFLTDNQPIETLSGIHGTTSIQLTEGKSQWAKN